MGKVSYLPNWEGFNTRLKEIVAEAKIDSIVVIRLCARKNLEKVLSFGTDRDKESIVWQHPGDHNHDSENVNPSKIFYAWMLDTIKDPFKRIGFISQFNVNPNYMIHTPETFDGRDIAPGQIAILYDSTKVQRKSTFEYSFISESPEAFVRVFALHKDIEEPQMSYYFD